MIGPNPEPHFIEAFESPIPDLHFIEKREAPAATLDPLLADIFSASESDSTFAPSIKTPKPKPIFTDARKLDNSRDWDNVKIAKPPQEELIALTTTTTTTTTTTATTPTTSAKEEDPILMLLSENNSIPETKFEPVRREIRNKTAEESDEFLDWLQSSQTTTTTTTTTTATAKSDRSSKSNLELDPVLVWLSSKEVSKAELKVEDQPDKVAYEIHRQVEGLEKDIKENDRLLEWLAAPEDSAAKTRVKRSAGIISASHHRYAIHSPLLTEPRTHDDVDLEVHPKNPKAVHHRRVREVAAPHPRIGFGGEEPPLYNRPRFSR
jgi:hypothetical protein